MNLAEHLKTRSAEICRDNGCTEDEHKCESYAYVRHDGQLLDICAPDFFQGTSAPHAAIALPWTGTDEELKKEIEEQTWEDLQQKAVSEAAEATEHFTDDELEAHAEKLRKKGGAK